MIKNYMKNTNSVINRKESICLLAYFDLFLSPVILVVSVISFLLISVFIISQPDLYSMQHISDLLHVTEFHEFYMFTLES